MTTSEKLAQIDKQIGTIERKYKSERTRADWNRLDVLKAERLRICRASGNSINWTGKTVVSTKQEAYYDVTVWRVPYTGTFDASRISKVIHDRFFSPSFGKFGGGTSWGFPKDNGDGTFTIESSYSIGD